MADRSPTRVHCTSIKCRNERQRKAAAHKRKLTVTAWELAGGADQPNCPRKLLLNPSTVLDELIEKQAPGGLEPPGT